MITIREPQPQDVERVAVLMRPVDRVECKAAGHTPWQALSKAKAMSVLVWTAEVDGWPHAMFGVAPGNVTTGLGYPWLLGSEEVRKRAKDFVRATPPYLSRVEALFPRLEGMISSRNTSAMRWLARLGFHIETHYTIMMQGEHMHRFSKGPTDV